MAKIKITQVKSVIHCTERQKNTMNALGIKKMHDQIEVESTPQVKGMIQKVRHLVTIEEI